MDITHRAPQKATDQTMIQCRRLLERNADVLVVAAAVGTAAYMIIDHANYLLHVMHALLTQP